MSDQTSGNFTDDPPNSDTLTEYDRTQLKLYARLLDAEADGAALSEISLLLFGIDTNEEPERARRIRDSHLLRAHWITQQGYQHLLVQS